MKTLEQIKQAAFEDELKKIAANDEKTEFLRAVGVSRKQILADKYRRFMQGLPL